MTRRTVAAASATLAALATLCACTSSDDTPSADGTTTTQPSDTTSPTQPSDTATTPAPAEPIDLMQIPEDTPLVPGTYAIGFLDDDGPRRAVLDVPAGYVGGGPVIGSEDADMAFWAQVTQVDTDPCLGGKHVSAGTSVHDLASLLAAQRHMRSTRPVPVTVGGYHGVHLTLTAPADIDRCKSGSVTIYGSGSGWLSLDVPGAVFNEWILNVDGHRVVGATRGAPNSASQDELNEMVESARFSLADQT